MLTGQVDSRVGGDRDAEIVRDIAPGAELFATAFNGIASFITNIEISQPPDAR